MEVGECLDSDECLYVGAAVTQWSEPQGEKSCITLDSGSDVSLLPLTFVADFAQLPHTQHLRDCQGQQLHVSGTKDAELIVNGLDVTQQFLNNSLLLEMLQIVYPPLVN